MRVTVTAIDQETAVLVRGTSAFGWRGKFGCPIVTGDAVFIPARGRERDLRVGNTISVEPGHESVTEVQLHVAGVEGMKPLDNPGDYLLNGKVVFCAPQGVVRVSIRDFVFELQRDELGGLEPAIDDRIQFALHGLSFWDKAEA